MKLSRKLTFSSLLITLSFALGACTVSKESAGVYRTPTENDGRIVTNSSAFQSIQPLRVTFKDFRQVEEYALYRSTSGQAEMVFLEIPERRTRNIALDFSELVANAVPMWRFNQGMNLTFEPSVSVKNRLGDFWVRQYNQRETGRACVGFVGAWDLNFNDPEKRPTKALFGYYCRPKGTPLSADDAAAYVQSIDVRGISVPILIDTAYALSDEPRPEPAKSDQIAALVIAQDGVAGGVSGIPAFPLLSARSFPPGDSCLTPSC